MSPEMCTLRAVCSYETRGPTGSSDGAQRQRCNLLRPRRPPCNCCKVHDPERDARELRSVAPLLVEGQLVGAVTLVRHAGKLIGATDPELLRPHVGAKLTVATMLDGSVPV